jgi:hypothetical protein
MRRLSAALAFVFAVAYAAAAEDDPGERAAQLKKEALAIFAANRGKGDAAEHGKALTKIEEAKDILEAAAKKDPQKWDAALVDIDSLLFWTRKTAPIGAMSSYSSPVKTPDDPKTPAPKTPDPKNPAPKPEPPRKPDPSPANPEAAAAAAYAAASAFAREHPDCNFDAALRFFRVSEEYPDTEPAREAFRRATWHQRQVDNEEEGATAKPPDETAPAPDASAVEAKRLSREAADAMNQDHFDQAVESAGKSLKAKETVDAHRIIGYAAFSAAERLRSQYAREYLEAQSEYYAASARGNKAGMDAALIKRSDLGKRLAEPIRAKYKESREAFQAGLKLAGGKDLESEVQIALSWSYDLRNRAGLIEARRIFERILGEYKSVSMTDDTLLAKARSELARVKGQLGGK